MGDRGKRGEITIEQFSNGLQALTEPATRYDLACVSASLGGCTAYAAKLEGRAVDCSERVSKLKDLLGEAYREVTNYANDDSGMGKVGAVMLRRTGAIQPPTPRKPQRYS